MTTFPITKTTETYSDTPLLMLDWYNTLPNEGPKPCVIWCHAGGGQRADSQPVSFCTSFSDAGYVSVSIDYRGGGGNFTNDAQKIAASDLWAAVRWCKLNASTLGIDPALIFVGGNSAGALTAVQANIGANDSDTSFFTENVSCNQSNGGMNGATSNAVMASATFSGAANNAFLNLINEGDAPNYAYHGALDTKIPVKQAQKTVDAMNAIGIPSTLTVWPDSGHKLGHFDSNFADLLAKFNALVNS